LLEAIRCCNKRGRKNRFGNFVSDSTCGHFIGALESNFVGKAILYCSGCKSFFEFKKTNGTATICLINKKDVNFDNVAKFEVLGYQSEL